MVILKTAKYLALTGGALLAGLALINLFYILVSEVFKSFRSSLTFTPGNLFIIALAIIVGGLAIWAAFRVEEEPRLAGLIWLAGGLACGLVSTVALNFNLLGLSASLLLLICGFLTLFAPRQARLNPASATTSPALASTPAPTLSVNPAISSLPPSINLQSPPAPLPLNSSDMAIFQQAVQLAQAGDKPGGYSRLKTLARTNPTNVDLILWTAFLSHDLAESQALIARAATLDPANGRVLEAQQWLKKQSL